MAIVFLLIILIVIFNVPVNSNIGGESGVLGDKDIINLDEGTYLQAYHTPGHTYDHISFGLYENNKLEALFSGDSFFNAGIGNCYSGDSKIAYNTVKDFYLQLPGEVKIYPGHDYMQTNLKFSLNIESDNQYTIDLLNDMQKKQPGEVVTNIDLEKKINPFLRFANNKIKESIKVKFNLSYLPSEEETFLKLRELRNNW
ncbi:hydroxyacylglutathione hydrolase C-terminal domain-containing protein [Candidatus Absconditicoccus praedator]|uniref:hydroxyacylglutathione hydrolase C-terminal domain-containing protein n=1 Tax=Candidatus Absconditicoccus praedator TaxID=2735562 RepID=UPI001E31F2B0|nr:hydroxyacylglutathione hydrolase C-terminal domain-containing protein [Candidatus Absconditicoccus praedator]UFX82586.1 hypothetical protein HLG78_00335 [Candidatus Absconditicoccus praedator]